MRIVTLIFVIVALVVIASFWRELARPGAVKDPGTRKRSSGKDDAA
jgi:hypothetical protein